MFPSRTISLAIQRPYHEVYPFLAEPANLARWTSGVLHAPLRHEDGADWSARYEDRSVRLHFTPINAFGVLDLTILDETGRQRIYRARAFPNGAGTELCCTIFQSEDESDLQFGSDAEWLRTDLAVLKSYLEAG